MDDGVRQRFPPPNGGTDSSGRSDHGEARSKIERDVNLQKMRDRAQKLRSDILQQVDSQIDEMLEEFVQDIEMVEQTEPMNGSSVNASTTKRGELPDKQFMSRRSVLTELLEINHIRTIYHIFVAILIVFSLNTIVYDLIETGTVSFDFQNIVWSFGKFPIVISLWASMNLATLIILYPAFQYWANYRSSGSVAGQDFVWLGLYILYQLCFLVLPVRVLVRHELPPASSVIILCEQTRLLMKGHAFVRHNIPRVLDHYAAKGSDSNNPFPGFSKFLYFLFAPTLVYRDSYPTAPKIRWGYVVSNFGQVVACLFYIYYIFERFCIPVFRNFDREHITPRALILYTFGCMMPGTLVLFIGFFAVLHSWLNAFAEMLRFGDRLFYRDWWNSSSFSNYYRTWNVVVHDWLYSYIYRDVYKLLRRSLPGSQQEEQLIGAKSSNRPAAMASVFLLSAVFHEYIISISFGFFYPVLFIMFAGAGFGFIFLPAKGAPRSGNVFMWVALFIGNGLLMCLYSMEWYARKNCEPKLDNFLDYLVPRSWMCNVNQMLA